MTKKELEKILPHLNEYKKSLKQTINSNEDKEIKDTAQFILETLVKQIAHEMMNIYIQEESSWMMYELSWNKYIRLI